MNFKELIKHNFLAQDMLIKKLFNLLPYSNPIPYRQLEHLQHSDDTASLAKGIYVIEYQVIAIYCPITKINAREGFPKKRPASNVKAIARTYISEAKKRPRSNIFLNCCSGPIKKHVPSSDSMLPRDTMTVKPVTLHVKRRALPANEHINERQKQPRKHCTRKSHESVVISLKLSCCEVLATSAAH